MAHDATQRRFAAALDTLVDQVRGDTSVLAAILCGSLSHDIVWTGSDIDVVLVTIDDKKVERSDVALDVDGVNVHAFLMPRADFRKTVESSLRSSFMHSLLAKGRLLYTHDPTIGHLFESLGGAIGERDAEVQVLRAATMAICAINKAHKWFVTRGDLDYTALWILYAATPLAQVEVLSARQLVDREVIPAAMRLNPGFFKTVYSDLLNHVKTLENVKAALDAIDCYLADRAPLVFRLLIEYLDEAGEARSSSDLEAHFTRNFDLHGVTTACEYLADHDLLGKASIPVRLTKRSNVAVQELAFFAVGAVPRPGSPCA